MVTCAPASVSSVIDPAHAKLAGDPKLAIVGIGTVYYSIDASEAAISWRHRHRHRHKREVFDFVLSDTEEEARKEPFGFGS